MAFTAGQKIRAADLNRLGAVVGRNQRGNLFLGTQGTKTRMMSVTAPVVPGRTYRVSSHIEGVPTAAGSVSQVELRYTTNNNEPTVSSLILGRALTYHHIVGIPDSIHVYGLFNSTFTGLLRVAIIPQRVIGSGFIDFGGVADAPALLMVEDVGDTIAATGTVY